MNRGEVWWAEVPETGRRPFLIMTRDAAIAVHHSVLAAPVTKTVRGIPTELALTEEDGMPQECAATFDMGETRPASAIRPLSGALRTTVGIRW